ncbi:AEC family transporter [Nocardioides sp. CCNWLW239]|uniref:AEC family transporter n=1 Tax=Nocardioides sp. CCNWLW239 TaxID=3128902 RepID=UPI003015B184
MAGVFTGFATISVLIALGALLAQLRILDERGQRTLSTVAFYVASPALLITVMDDSDLGFVLSGNLVAVAAGVLVAATLVATVETLRHRGLGNTVVAVLCGSYANAGNLGLPIAAYVLGDPVLVAPTLLLQMLVLQPLALVLLDVDASTTRLSVWEIVRRPLTNPITVASAIGVTLSVSDVDLPEPVSAPLELVAGMAVPSMLIAYGVALRLGPLPGRGVPALDLAAVVATKQMVQPVAAYLVGRFILGLDADALLAVTVLSALPTAQNVFVVAQRYGRATLLARDVIFVTTLGTVPAILLVVLLLT